MEGEGPKVNGAFRSLRIMGKTFLRRRKVLI